MSPLDLKRKQEEFINRIVFSDVIGSAFRRVKNGVYKTTEKEERKKIREKTWEVLQKLCNSYDSASNEAHIGKINEFISKTQSHGLRGGKFSFGVAQKLVNLYMKYQWCRGGKEPRHCPLDRNILNDIDWKGPSWTNPKFDEKCYEKAIGKAQEKAKTEELPLPEWELKKFSELNPLRF